MLKRLVNTARIELDIVPVDPLLVKSGLATVGGVDMSFVRTYRFGQKEEPFVPGSSLKGMVRSYAEKICRSLRDDPVPVCLPYVSPGNEQQEEKRQASCGLRLEQYGRTREISTSAAYRNSCPACRLFGSHKFAGRFAVSDAYLTDSFKAAGRPLLEIRDGVAIDRITGGAAAGAKYDLEVLTRGEFAATMEIRNFERWQLGLIGLVLRDMEDGLVRLGFGKSRGLGRFEAKINRFRIDYYHRNVSQLRGLASLCPTEEQELYGFFQETGNGGPPLAEPVETGLRRQYDLTKTWKEAIEPAVADLVAFVQENEWPRNLESFLKGGK